MKRERPLEVEILLKFFFIMPIIESNCKIKLQLGLKKGA
jgi:hypothetical protein